MSSDGIGADPEEVDAQAVSEEEFAEHLGVDTRAPGEVPADLDETGAVGQLVEVVQEQRELLQEQSALLDEQQKEIDDLRERVEEVEDEEEENADRIREAFSAYNNLSDRVKAVETGEGNGEEEGEESSSDDESGFKSSSSPLDFFLNCQQFYVNETLSENRARAVETVRRWEEFGRRDSVNGGVIITKTHVRDALTAIMGARPHRETVRRVYSYIGEMGGDDVKKTDTGTLAKTPQRDGEDCLKIDDEALERFDESRYVGMNLLTRGNVDLASGGVTPVVTGERA